MDNLTPDRITSIIRPIVDESGLIFVDAVIRGHTRSRVIEVFIDGEGAITADVCAGVSRRLTEVLDSGPMRDEPYTLTVSSPGIERPLSDPRQYRKHAGRKVRITLSAAAGGGTISGVIRDAGERSLTIQPSGGGEERTMEFGDVVEARVEPPW